MNKKICIWIGNKITLKGSLGLTAKNVAKTIYLSLGCEGNFAKINIIARHQGPTFIYLVISFYLLLQYFI